MCMASFNEDVYRDNQLNKYLESLEMNEGVSNCCGVPIEEDTDVCSLCGEHYEVISLGEWKYQEYENAMCDRAEAERDERD